MIKKKIYDTYVAFLNRKEKAITVIPKKRKTLLKEADMRNRKVFATTVLREAQDAEITGFLLEIDWNLGKVTKKLPIPATTTSQTFWNPRGGNRGGRGITEKNGVLYVATAITIRKYDLDLNYLGELSNPKFAGLHELFADEDGIWVTSTIFDLIIKVDFDGKTMFEWYGGESKFFQKKLKFSHRKKDFNEINANQERLHLNTVWKQGNNVYALSNFKRALIKIYPNPEEVLIKDFTLQSPHNGIFTLDDKIVINNTKQQSIKVYDLETKKCIKNIKTKIEVIKDKSEQFKTGGWQRGLSHVKNSVYLVGTSPATIFEVDIENNLIGKIVQIDTNPKHCIHGLIVV